MTLVSANIRFVPIFEGFIGERASNDNGVIENMDFHDFRRYVFGSFGNHAKANIAPNRSFLSLVFCRLSTDHKILDLQ